MLVVLDALRLAQNQLAPSRDECDPLRLDLWDKYQHAIDRLIDAVDAPQKAESAAYLALQNLQCPYNSMDHGVNWHASAHAWDEAIITAMRTIRALPPAQSKLFALSDHPVAWRMHHYGKGEVQVDGELKPVLASSYKIAEQWVQEKKDFSGWKGAWFEPLFLGASFVRRPNFVSPPVLAKNLGVQVLCCPSCGKIDPIEIHSTNYPGERKVICNFHLDGCGLATAGADGDSAALAVWNRRVSSSMKSVGVSKI